MTDATELNRLFWHSRRGMLELDVLLVPFVREVFSGLGEDDQRCYRKLLENERGAGYPKERAAIMAKNRGILKDLKAASCKDMLTTLKAVDQDLLKAAVSGEKFQELFFTNCQDDAIAAHIKSVL